MHRSVLVILAILLVSVSGTAAGQARRGSGYSSPSYPQERFEVGVHGGYVWTGSRDVWLDYNEKVKLDIRSGGMWGVTVDINAQPGKQIELLYNRQESQLTVKRRYEPENDLADVAVEYWQIGALGGFRRDNLLPFGSLTLGATRMVTKGTRQTDDWRFSVIPGLGVKVYSQGRVGFRAQARAPITIMSGGVGIGCGTGGCATTVAGEGTFQVDVSGGLFLTF